MVTTLPPASIIGRKARVSPTSEYALISCAARKSSRCVSRNGLLIAGLGANATEWRRKSSVPHRSFSAPATDAICSSERTSRSYRGTSPISWTVRATRSFMISPW